MCYNGSMKSCLLFAACCLALRLATVPVHAAVDMTRPASVQITVQDKDGRPLPQAAVVFGGETIALDAAGKGRFETRSPQPAPDIFWTAHLHIALAGFAPCDSDIRFFPGEQSDLPVTLFPLPDPSKPRGEHRFEPASGIPPHPIRLMLLLPDGTPAAGWKIGPNAYVANSYRIVVGIALPPIYVYGMDKPIPVDAHGAVSFGQAEDHLIVLSPQGAPFLYPLYPQTWPTGLHSVTLHLPPVRRVQRGRVTLPDGKPAAGISISVAETVTGNEQWQINFPYNKPTGTLLTAADGTCALPQYFGTTYQYAASKPPLTAYDLATPDGSVLHSYGIPDALKPSEYKEVRLLFVSEIGKPLPEIAADSVTAFQGSRQVSLQGGQLPTDQNGSHLFLPITVDRVDITAQGQDWNPLTKMLDLPGTDSKTFTITMPQSLHFKPLSGVLLDPLGQPLSSITVNLHKVNRYASDTNYPEGSTTTDAQGRFAFAAAPDSCMINLYRTSSEDNDGLPGWIDPPRVTPQTRHLTIRLKPFLPDAVRVLLPPTVTAAPKEVYLESAPATDELPDYLLPTFDPKTHTLLWNRIPPGRYTLTTADATLPGAARIDMPVTLRAQGETQIDLRDKAASFPQTPKPGTVGIYLTDTQGKPLSGVSVTMWTNQEAWDQHFPADLTDDNGHARLPLGIGKQGVVVAHLAGKLIGYSEITGQEEVSISFPMSAAQTVTVPLKPLPLVNGSPPYDRREVSLHPLQMKPDEAQAVFTVLGLLNTSTEFRSDGPVPAVSLRSDADGIWSAEDLPPGFYHLQISSDIALPNAPAAASDSAAASEISLP
jgi:5-hydroxyisourate hydrolase-like protein (transthyretin family)